MSHDFGSCYCHKRYSRRECSLIDGLYVSNFDLDWKYDGLIEIEKIYTEKIMEKKKECKFHIHPPFKDLKLKAYGITATPLIFACLNGNLDMVKRVVEVWGANINQIGDIVTSSFESSFERMERITHMIDCLTPLFAAALKKKKDIVCYLLGKGAIISHITRSNLFGTDGLTPLHAAFYLEKPESDESPDNQNEIIRILVASGAGPSGLSSKGVPIWMTGWECSRDLFGELYGPDPGWCNTNGIKTLIQLGMNPNGRGKYGRTLLHHLTGLANFKDNVEIVMTRG